MNFVSKILCAATAILLSAPGAPAQAQQQSPASSRLFGAGLNVVDLARSLSFYAGVLGMKIAARHSNERNSEVVLNFGGEGEAVLVLVQVKGRTQPYAIGDGFGRLIMPISQADTVETKIRFVRSASLIVSMTLARIGSPPASQITAQVSSKMPTDEACPITDAKCQARRRAVR